LPTKTSLGKLVKHAEGMERRLGDIHQDIRDFISLHKDARRDDVEVACRSDLHVVDLDCRRHGNDWYRIPPGA
ncbi:hypothetical protein C8A05DRAFT_18752, partial [Staphylotrichum tortipilum]